MRRFLLALPPPPPHPNTLKPSPRPLLWQHIPDSRNLVQMHVDRDRLPNIHFGTDFTYAELQGTIHFSRAIHPYKLPNEKIASFALDGMDRVTYIQPSSLSDQRYICLNP